MLLKAIGTIRSPFRSKFGVPRQHGLACVSAVIDLDSAIVDQAALRGLDQATHLWVIFGFHLVARTGRQTVRPPRLGGNRRLGVLATRSPFRPNPLGLSAVRLVRVSGTSLEVEGGDFVDGSPVFDIKPYLPWADAIADARVAWADEAPPPLRVVFSDQAESQLATHRDPGALRRLLEKALASDPRPAYHDADPTHRYGIAIADLDVRFTVVAGEVRIEEIVSAPNP